MIRVIKMWLCLHFINIHSLGAQFLFRLPVSGRCQTKTVTFKVCAKHTQTHSHELNKNDIKQNCTAVISIIRLYLCLSLFSFVVHSLHQKWGKTDWITFCCCGFCYRIPACKVACLVIARVEMTNRLECTWVTSNLACFYSFTLECSRSNKYICVRTRQFDIKRVKSISNYALLVISTRVYRL